LRLFRPQPRVFFVRESLEALEQFLRQPGAILRSQLQGFDFEFIRAHDSPILALGRRFDGVLAWDSFFHLQMDDQRAMFARFSAHALPGAPLMFTSGTAEGLAIGAYCGEPLYHASLDPAEYERLLTSNGFTMRAHQADDPECGGHTVWLATHTSATP
jgi:hypothetical protein